MIGLFRTLNPVNLLVLGILSILLRLGIILNPPTNLDFSIFESYASVLFNLPAGNLFDVRTNLLLALIITLVQAVLFNRVINEYNLLGKQSFLPALMYVTCSSLLVHFLVLTPALICNFLVIWILDKFLSVHRKESAQATMFDLGMMVAVGALIYLPFIAMMLLLWICLIIFRPFNWREWLAGVIGFITIYFFIAVAYYWTDSIEKLRDFEVPLAIEFKLFQINIYNYLVLIPLLLILFLSVISLQQRLYRSYVHIRKSFLLLFFMLIFMLLSFFITSKYQVHHFLLAIPAASVFMGYYFMSAGKKWFYESLYLILVGFIIYFQFA
ncbi:MAG: beta-carotene 15,15'-monooxygenase [Sphingobacteriaceae bacterium]|nr:beta-carotene 15,15'-monooxygenase [Sphingobacteriaceae bacterium]